MFVSRVITLKATQFSVFFFGSMSTLSILLFRAGRNALLLHLVPDSDQSWYYAQSWHLVLAETHMKQDVHHIQATSEIIIPYVQ